MYLAGMLCDFHGDVNTGRSGTNDEHFTSAHFLRVPIVLAVQHTTSELGDTR